MGRQYCSDFAAAQGWIIFVESKVQMAQGYGFRMRYHGDLASLGESHPHHTLLTY